MWNSKTDIIEYCSLTKEYKKVFNSVLSKANLPDYGVVVMLDDNDYSKYKNPLWNDLARYMNIKQGGVEIESPQRLLKLMESSKYEHLIWMSEKACRKNCLEFAWVLFHEIQHFNQNLIAPELSEASFILQKFLGKIDIEEPKIQNTVPTEMDANLYAWRNTYNIFGPKKTDDFIKRKVASGNYTRSFSLLLNQGLEEPYDVCCKTSMLINKYYDKLKEHSDKTPINLDKIYNSLNNKS
ncbi:MAG: hypothetical protein HQ530_03695 [Parcubacteria group bacterium]|nr:hypothetical protein [Parcubacteria group bacterium]